MIFRRDIVGEAAAIAAGIAARKAEALEYAAEAKRQAAEHYGVESTLFFGIPFEQWRAVAAVVLADKRAAGLTSWPWI